MELKLKENQLVTDLYGGKSDKLDDRIDLLGKLDLVQSFMVRCTYEMQDSEQIETLKSLSQDIFYIMSEISGAVDKQIIDSVFKTKLEEIINLISTVKTKFEFVLPGALNKAQAQLDVLRCIIRQAELEYCKIYDKYKTSQYALEWVNKLSLYIYYLARRQ